MTESQTQATMGVAPDWREVVDSLFTVFVAVGLEAFKIWARSNARERSQPSVDQEAAAVDEAMRRAEEAAALLDVNVNASADEIRRALRARLSEARLHPDQGGDENAAKELIAAKNLLIERLKGWP
jgi:hypothetical protein